ncbi:sodium-dependent transporter [uncultured Marinobacter sp.]|uniref:sodium-dependent transporter n=1 Tax=uncultured Marinobacter sp. TaxID=187379 RepID=UPI000C0AD7AE|nr:sodium-dependent transporter [Marinobacter sp.]MBI43549.1 sodium-dependent transporter [Oceanospirillales bacterium]|tara:strand:+ start:4118 stop:5500 length:1383 start_codon:yes stop_codon:yes gene_type:complete
MTQHTQPHQAASSLWSSRLAFILAAAGSAVGLGNIWKFPYITGENGGGAFVLVYLVCIALIGVPVLIAETVIGRRGGQSPIATMRSLTGRDGAARGWRAIGWNGVVASFLVLSFYSVIGGWSLVYIGKAAAGVFTGADAEAIGAQFGALLANPWELLLWHSVFMALVILIVGRGIRSGLERAVNMLMPLLFVLLVAMVIYAMNTDGFARGVRFMFSPDFSKLTTEGVLVALGHAAFTLSIGIGVLMAYGSYLPTRVNIARTAVTIAVIDTGVALLAGLAIFPLVFANGLEPGSGPGLIFVTLPLAFGKMSGGVLFGAVFFVLLLVAAITSAISMLEPVVEWLEEHKGFSRARSALFGGLVIWFVGIGTVLSFNLWSDVHPLGFIAFFKDKTVFDLLDFLVSSLMMPLGSLAIALFAGWALGRQGLAEDIGLRGLSYRLFMVVLRYLTPAGIAVVFLYNLV